MNLDATRCKIILEYPANGDRARMENDATDFALEIAYQQLRSQKEDLRAERNKSAVALTFSGLIATVFSSLVEPSQLNESNYFFLGVGLEVWIFMVLFSTSIIYSVLASFPRKCTFDLSSKWVLENYGSDVLTQSNKEDLARYCEDFFDQNEAVIKQAQAHVASAFAFAFSQIVAWVNILF